MLRALCALSELPNESLVKRNLHREGRPTKQRSTLHSAQQPLVDHIPIHISQWRTTAQGQRTAARRCGNPAQGPYQNERP